MFLQKSFFIFLQKVFIILFLSVPTKNVHTENFGNMSICRKLCLLVKNYHYYFKFFCEIATNFLKKFRKLFHSIFLQKISTTE